jgi:hypothetical protein
MNRKSLLFISLLLFSGGLFAQDNFKYNIDISSSTMIGFPGLHSFAYGQYQDKWVLIGGRLDGLHARQPFNAFRPEFNNRNIYVIDWPQQQLWTASVEVLPTGIKEQLQSTNMNFHQAADTLYIIGGYAFSQSANNHITFPKLTTVLLPDLIDAIVAGGDISPYFKQITNDIFAVTGGQLGKIDDTFYLVGGHRFDGPYNPNNMPTYTQTYSNSIQKFRVDNSGTQLSFNSYSVIEDPVHLRRRDYNLLPQLFPDGSAGYTISAGVFQPDVDLPYLYPVDIKPDGYVPVTDFNQYLSHYHGAKVCFYQAEANQMHNLFFGGLSQYYYENGALIQDNLVPFVKTISRLSRYADGSLQEYNLPESMPQFQATSGEFIANLNLPHHESGIILLDDIDQDTIFIGHIVGGIYSPSLNPFAGNQTNTTSADNTVFTIKLIRDDAVGYQPIEAENPYQLKVFPNPAKEYLLLEYKAEKNTSMRYYISNTSGSIVLKGQSENNVPGTVSNTINVGTLPAQILLLTVVIDNKYTFHQSILKAD